MSTTARTVAMAVAVAAMTVGAAQAQDALAPWRWHARLLLVFAPDAADADLAAQRRVLAAAPAQASERDLVVLDVVGEQAPALADAAGGAALRRRFAVPPTQFAALLIGKDGGEKLRASAPIPAERLFAVIDAMPVRRAERKCVQ